MTKRQVVTAARIGIDDQVGEMLALVMETGFRTCGDPERLARRTAILATLKWVQENRDVILQAKLELDKRQQPLTDDQAELI